jgi:thioredoxin reductase
VEKLPQVNADFSTSVPGLYISGDLAGIPLLKFALDSGARAVRSIAADLKARAGEQRSGTDLAIIGGGVSGMAAAVEAQAQGLSFVVVESSEPLSTLVNFPKQKPIYTYPTSMRPEGRLQVAATVKETLLDELREQVERFGITTFQGRVEAIERAGDGFRLKLGGGAAPLQARRVLLAIGRSGEFRRLGVPGESLDKVYNRLHDPKDYVGKQALVVGGGDTAVETAVALAQAGAAVTLSYRKPELARPKPENVAGHVSGRVRHLAGRDRVARGRRFRRNRRRVRACHGCGHRRARRDRRRSGRRRGPQRHDADERDSRHAGAGGKQLRQRRGMLRMRGRRRDQRLPAAQAADAVLADERAARGARDGVEAYRTSRHDRIRTPAWPTPLLKSSGSPNIWILLPAANTTCWSTMNGALARSPTVVVIFGLSVESTLPSFVVS